MFGLDPVMTIAVASVVTVAYSMIGGLTGVLLTDLVQFIIAMVGAVWAAVHVVGLPQVGGLGKLLADPRVQAKMDIVPNMATTPHDLVMAVFLIPLLVTWWSIYYPGAEPGGGGYVAQRLLAAKNEKHALGACLFFNVMHYALRPWPWILVALASLVVFPDVASLQARFPHLDPKIVQDDLAYPAMLTFLPQGLMGIMVASLAAAYMSTMSTQVNYGSSIVVSDLYLRFINPKASDSQQVWLGRIVTVVLMFTSCWFALQMKDALSNFNLMMQVGAGTGLVLILRWFWWRINAAAEIAAMTLSFGMAIFWHYSSVGHDVPAWKQMVIGVAVTTAGSLLVALLTGPTETQKLREFYSRVQPGGAGWTPILERAEHERIQIQDPRLGRGSDLGIGIVCSILASVGIWALIFAGGWAIYGRWGQAGGALAVTLVCAALLPSFIGKLRIRD
jgi:Na+/proline symporter